MFLSRLHLSIPMGIDRRPKIMAPEFFPLGLSLMDLLLFFGLVEKFCSRIELDMVKILMSIFD